MHQIYSVNSKGVPSGVFAEFPIARIYKLRLCPDTTLPGLPLNDRERTVYDIADRDGDEVRWNWDGLECVLLSVAH